MPEGTNRVRAGDRTLAASPSINWRMRQESNLHGCYTITGFRPDKHANARIRSWRMEQGSNLRSGSPRLRFSNPTHYRSGGSPRYCPEFPGVKARYFACKACGPNWCQVMDSSHLLTLTRGANHCQFLPGEMEPTQRLELCSDGYKPSASPSMLGRRNGASSRNCTLRLVFTKDALRYQSLAGVASPE